MTLHESHPQKVNSYKSNYTYENAISNRRWHG